MILTNIRRTGVFILFSVMNILIYGQVDLLTKHMECEQRIKECYPNLGKKNANDSYSIYCKDQWTIIKDANFSYSSTAIFVEPGNLPQPLCETTITISKNKITLKIHDAVMISPDVSDKPIWSEDPNDQLINRVFTSPFHDEVARDRIRKELEKKKYGITKYQVKKSSGIVSNYSRIQRSRLYDKIKPRKIHL